MSKAKYYVEVDSYWQNSPSIFIGPYASLEDAQYAANISDAVFAEHQAQDVKYNVRFEIHNTRQARQAGMCQHNTISNLVTAIPDDTEGLSRLWDVIGERHEA